MVLFLMWWRWSALLTSTLNPDLAHAAGMDPRREQLILTVALAVVVAVAVKVIGALLIVALLIIPAATARPFSKTPEQMVLIATAIGGLSAAGGLQVAYHFDTPTGPTIVCLAAVFFALSTVGSLIRGRAMG